MMKTITFLIPTFENLALLKKNVPSILDEAMAGDRILISEDGVTNRESLDYWKEKYRLQRLEMKNGELWQAEIKWQGKKLQFGFLQRRENGRFARNVNEAVDLITDDYFILLNNDVELTPGVRKQLMGTLTPKTFAVTAKEIDVNNQQECGRNKLWWRRGRFWHERDENLHHQGETAWACGGSSLFVTKIWRDLNGFDRRYYPAYWEDIDLSLAARKRNYQVIYQPKAVVKHVHETTNESVFGQQKMAEMSWRNGSRFAWKNGSWKQKWQFLFFYPFWQVKQFPQLQWWWLVLTLALVTRVALITTPNGLTVDEAAIAYNGFGIVTQRRDEWSNRLPVSFRSFGDFKAPLAIYVNGFFTVAFGREIWAIRLPFVLAGVGAIWLMMLIVDLLLREIKPNHRQYGAAVGLLMTFLPWHLHYSHLGFENNLALVLVLAGGYFYGRVRMQATDWRGVAWRKKWWSWSLMLSGISFALALYSYHSAKVMVPVLLIFLLLADWREIWSRMKLFVLPIMIGVVILVPLVKDSFWGEGFTRAYSSFLLSDEVTWGEKIQLLGEGFAAHFTPDYLFWGQVNTAEIEGEILANVRHGDGQHGVLNLAVVFLLLVGVIAWGRFGQVRRQLQPVVILGVVIILAGVLPAAMTTQVPHSNQAILSLPGFLLLAIAGLASWRYFWRKRLTYYPSFGCLFFVITGLIFLSDLTEYRNIMAKEIPRSPANYQLQRAKDYLFATGLLEAFQYTRAREKEVNQILVSTGREHEYIYALLARGTKPIEWQHGSLSNKYVFLEQIYPGDWLKENILVVMKAKSGAVFSPEARVELVKEFYNGSGEPILAIYQTL